MSFAFDDVSCGGQLQVGTGVVPSIGIGDNKINGSAHVEGPMVVGPPQAFPSATATMMIGPLTNDDKDCPHPEKSLGVSGKQPMVLEARGNFLLDGDLYVTGSVDCISVGRLESRHKTADGKPKLFDIPHPTKGEGHRLAHACIEGPEVGVYYRGRLRKRRL